MDPVQKRSSLPWILASCGAIATLATAWSPVPPVAAVAAWLVIWIAAVTIHSGPVLGVSLPILGWLGLTLLGTSAAGLLWLDPSTGALIFLALSYLALPAVVSHARERRRSPGDRRLLFVATASSGAVAWFVGVAWSWLAPTGSGLSWAMLKDSTLNVWEARRILAAGYTPSVIDNGNPQPLLASVVAGLVPPGTPVDADARSVEALLAAYTSTWTILIGLSCLTFGILAGSPLWRAGLHRSALIVAFVASLVPLLGQVSGLLVELGQANGHLTIAILCAALILSSEWQHHPGVALSGLLAAGGLLAATWLPFALLPSVLACVAWYRARPWPSRDLWLPRVLPGAALWLWCLAVYAWPLTFDVATGSLTDVQGGPILVTETYSRPGFWESYTNPVSVPLLGVLVVTVTAVSVLVARTGQVPWGQLCALVALVLGGVVVVWPSIHAERLPYYPAKYIWIACVVAGILAAQLVATWLVSQDTARRRLLALALVGLPLATAAATLPGPATPLPLAVAGSGAYGSHDEVAALLISGESNTMLQLPWRLHPTHDTTIALMASSFGPSSSDNDLAEMRYVLRNFRNDFSADVACRLADAESRPVALLTADPQLPAEIAVLCPGRLEVIVVGSDST